MKLAHALKLGLMLAAVAALAACGTADTEPSPDPTPTPPSAGATPTPVDTPEPDFDAESYFSGRTITINVPFAPGGGYDTTGRLIALHMPKYFPGSPEIEVQNLPGAGGLRGLQTTVAAEPDGFTAGQLHPSLAVQALTGEDDSIDIANITIIGSPTGLASPGGSCTRRGEIDSWDQVLEEGITLTDGGVSPGEGTGSAGSRWIEVLGGPARVVGGYGGTSEIMAAFDRGELTANSRCGYGPVQRLYPEWIEQRTIKQLFWFRAEPEPEYLEALDDPMPPHVFDLPGVEHTQEQRDLLDAWISVTLFGRTIVLPPGVSPEVEAVWSDAFAAVVEDPEFIQGAEAAGIEVGLATGEVMRDAYQTILNLSPEGMDFFERLLAE